MNNESVYTPDHVDIYRIRLDLAETEIAVYAQWLSPDERARADKFLSAAKAREFTITRAYLKKILAQTLAEDPAHITIAHADQGKPYLVCNGRHTRIRFSVSHSHGLALIAITLDRDIGIDVEQVRADVDHDALARRFFSSAEYEALQVCAETTRLQAFFTTWTRKEAIVKATGKGIALGLQQFDVSVVPGLAPRVLATRWELAGMPDWTLIDIQTDKDYVASLAVSGGNITVCYRDTL